MKPNDYQQLTSYQKYLKPVAIAVFTGAAVSGVLLVLAAMGITMAGLPQSLVEPLAVAAAILGAFVCGFACAKLLRHKLLLFGALAGFVLFLLFAFVNLTISGAGFGLLGLLRIALLLPASMIGSVVGGNQRKKRRV